MKSRKKNSFDEEALFAKDRSREKNRSHGKKTNFEDEDFDWESFDDWDNDFSKFRN